MAHLQQPVIAEPLILHLTVHILLAVALVITVLALALLDMIAEVIHLLIQVHILA